MTIQEFAKMLDGREMGNEISKVDAIRAKELGFVVVFGYSDDGTELRGAIDEEVSCPDGKTIYLDKDGIFHECESGCKHACKAREKCKTIEAIWTDEEDQIPWRYKTDIPHAAFDINDGDEGVFCRGIVFDIKSLSESNEKLNITLEELDLSVRSYNCLKRSGVNSVGDIVKKSMEELCRVRNMGRKCVEEVEEKMGEMGLELRK